jgi:hypothetical protein
VCIGRAVTHTKDGAIVLRKKGERRNHENDRGYTNPRAYGKAKESLGNVHGLSALFRELESLAGDNSVRIELAVALHAYVIASDDGRRCAHDEYHDWVDRFCGGCAPPFDVMPAAERLHRRDRVHERTPDLMEARRKIESQG